MILITGGAGFIGSHLAKRLIAKGEDVRILDDLSRGDARQVPGKADLMVGDVTNIHHVRTAMQDVETVIHMAAINGTDNFYRRPADVLRVGIQGTLNVLQAMEGEGTYRIQFFSSSEVYQQPSVVPTPDNERGLIPDFENPRFSYAGSKIAGELLTINVATEIGADWQIIRPHNVYGPYMGHGHVVANLMSKIARAREGNYVPSLPLQGSGEETRTFCYIDDMIDGVMLALDKGEWNTHYNVGAEDELSIRDLANEIASVMDVQIGQVIPSEPPAGGTSRRRPDISKLAALGYRPRISLSDGLAATYRWWQADQQEALLTL